MSPVTRRPRPAILVILLGGLLLASASLMLPAGTVGAAAQGSTATSPQPTAAGAQAAQPRPGAPVQAPKLSILLLMDVSGSMGSNNKLAQAKEAAIQAIWSAGPQMVLPGAGTPAVAGTGLGPSAITSVPIPGIPPSIQQQFDKYLRAMDALQQALGPDMKAWVSKAETRELGKILQRCEALMSGLAFEQKSALMQRLSPMVEKMHYSLAGYVNDQLGGGLKYVLPGKTPSNPEFGGLFTLKKSDHDAIYLGAKSEEARNLHRELSRMIFGDEFAKTTESCLEASRYTLERVEGPFGRTFEKFTGPQSNLDWMRSPSGSKWVQEYVDRAGTVVDLDSPLNAADPNRSYMKQLSSYTDDELRALGVTMDRRALKDLGYNLGLMSDFERQLALNQHRHALEKGLTFGTLDAADDAMLKAKYGPRYLEVVQASGGTVPPDMQQYVDEIVAIGKKAKGGATLSAAEEAAVRRFDDFAKQAREAALRNQVSQYQQVSAQLAGATDDATRAALTAKATEILDDTQAALHNYQQLHPGSFADDLVTQMRTANAGLGDTVAQRLTGQPWVAGEAGLETCARTQLAAEGKLPAAAAGPPPPKAVITDSTGLWQQIKQHPGHAFAKFAQYGGYAWMAYDVLSLVREGKDAEALKTAATYGGIEGTTYATEYVLSSKFGAGAGGWVTLSALGGFMAGNMAANWMIGSQVDEMTLQMLSGYSADGTQHYADGGALKALGSQRTDADIMSVIKPGTVGDTTVGLDANGNVTLTKKVSRLQRMGHGEYIEVERDETTTVPKAQIIAHQRLQEMFNVMRGKFNDAVDRGDFTGDERRSLDELPYEDPHFTTHPQGRFFIPNSGGLSLREYEFYKREFESAFGKWALDKNPMWQGSAYGASMENAYKAKWAMFRNLIAAVGESKKRDREFSERVDKMHPDELAALKQMIAGGIPFFLGGRRLTADDIQKRIDAREEEIRRAIENAKNPQSVQLPDDLKKLLDEIASDTVVPNLAAGNVEFGIMPYSGSCGSAFGLFGFTYDAVATKSAIESLSAGGGTPMSPALYQARHAILQYGRGQAGTIILLCDGQNDCSENPVKAAESIFKREFSAAPGSRSGSLWPTRFLLIPAVHAAPFFAADQAVSAPTFVPINMSDPIPPGRQNIPITVSTVGFQVTPDQQQTLDAIAQAGGGISGTAQNMAQLTQAFSSAIRQATLVTPGGSGGGGGGGPVLPTTGLSTAGMAAILLLGGCAVLVAAIVVLRKRRTAVPATPAIKVRASLHVTYADGGTKTFPVTAAHTTIGRGEHNALVLRDPGVSSRHAEIVASAEGFLLRDLGSANGTRVNGAPVTEARLRIGDIVVVGSTRLTFGE